MIRKYIDNTRENQNLVSLLSIGMETTRHGEKFRLRKGAREVDSTYSINEAIQMLRCSNAVIEFWEQDNILTNAILTSGLKIVESEPNYNYIDTSKNPYLELI